MFKKKSVKTVSVKKPEEVIDPSLSEDYDEDFEEELRNEKELRRLSRKTGEAPRAVESRKVARVVSTELLDNGMIRSIVISNVPLEEIGKDIELE